MTWYNNDWGYRFKVTIDNSKVSSAIKGLGVDFKFNHLSYYDIEPKEDEE